MKTCTLLISSCILFLTACNNNKTTTTDSSAHIDSAKTTPLGPVTLATVSPSPDFPTASLSMGAVKAEKVGLDSTKVSFNFIVKNYELKMQTADNANKMCNNSDKGQHIHFIMDNGPYKALYEPKNEITLVNGSEHYLIAFLSRSYHESIKSKGAAVVYHFSIDEKGNLKKMEEPKTPMIFYSRPKGDYFGKDVNNVLLDFYVWNCTLAPDGYKVKAEIANHAILAQKLSATIDKWEPHFIQNLGLGKCTVALTLVDKDGKKADGPQTTASREFTLAEQAISPTTPPAAKTDSVKK